MAAIATQSVDDETDDPDDNSESEEFALSEPNGLRLLTKEISNETIREAIASNLPASEHIDREVLLRQCAQALGFSRLSKKLRSRLNKTIGAEVRYGRMQVDSGGVTYRGNDP